MHGLGEDVHSESARAEYPTVPPPDDFYCPWHESAKANAFREGDRTSILLIEDIHMSRLYRSSLLGRVPFGKPLLHLLYDESSDVCQQSLNYRAITEKCVSSA